MTSIDAMAEAYHSERDPQFQIDDVPQDATEEWEALRQILDEASLVISKIIDKAKTEDAMVVDALISGALLRAERNAE